MKPGAARLSPLHRLAPSAKLMALALAGTGLVLVGDWRVLAAALLASLGLYRLAGIGQRRALAQLRPLLWLLALLFLVQGLWQSWELAGLVVLRIVTLVLLAALVTLTTPTEALIGVIERALGPLRRFGVDPAKVALAFSLALRFIPVIGQQAAEIRDAQRARGLGSNPLALALPLIVRTLKMAGDVADAIDARSPYAYPPGDPPGSSPGSDDDLPPRFVVEPLKTHARITCKDVEPQLKT